MASNNQGIQTLLEAEKEASKIVAKARSCKLSCLILDRVQRLKDARQEAQKEIEALKQQKNQEFIEYEKKYAGDSGDSVKQAQVETKKQLELIGADFAKNKDTVIQKLLETIGKCEPVIHPNVLKPKFGNVEKIVKQTLQNQFPDRFIDRPCLDGIIFDVGLSTHQMSNPDRGFSFGQEDMRMESRGRFDCTGDLGRTLTAEALVNSIDRISYHLAFNVDQLTEIFLKYGEEKQARKIALAIERHRNVTPITTTIQLAQIFAEGKGRAEQKLRKFAHPAIKPLRMFINNELSQLHEGLIGSESLLKPNANCLVITPHSIQDRIVKKFFKSCQHGIPNEIKLVNPNLKSKNSLRSLRLMKPLDLDDENVDIFDENYDSNNSTTFPTHSITQMDGNQTSKANTPNQDEEDLPWKSQNCKLRIAKRTINRPIHS
ncbi:putative methyltransferase-like protein 15 [Globomyces sp. JEL0801]|nr:putative methyltransferase-like protein 15 [Globomyces sp. JEL0801]